MELSRRYGDKANLRSVTMLLDVERQQMAIVWQPGKGGVAIIRARKKTSAGAVIVVSFFEEISITLSAILVVPFSVWSHAIRLPSGDHDGDAISSIDV